MGRVKEMLIDKEYNERQIAIAKYEKENLKQLNEDLIAVNEAIMTAYSRFSEMTAPITMLNQKDFDEVEDVCIEIQQRIEFARTYLLDITSDVKDYYKPYDYKESKEATTSEAIDNELRRFVADNVADVEVCASGFNDEVKYGFIKNNVEELEEATGRNINAIKTFKSI